MFTKYPHPSNFSFASTIDDEGRLDVGDRSIKLCKTTFVGGIHHLRAKGPWRQNGHLSPLQPPSRDDADETVGLSSSAGLRLRGNRGEEILVGPSGSFFGVSGEASLFQFALPPESRFFGMGEKTYGRVELSGLRTKFWNTDVWSDFHFAQWGEHPSDPPYFSTPYVVARIGNEYVGFLLDNPYPTWISTPGTDESRVFVEWQRTDARLILGSEGGEPNLWIIYGPTLREVTHKLQKLVGPTPLPPLWSLGYHQSRWGYGGHDDLLALDEKFEECGIPCDGLWLDLDYMRGYRIFETSNEMFPDGVPATAKALEARFSRRIVPILDPGVKREAGYRVYDDGLQKGVFCKNAEGKPFVGLVWPGETAFPDFTIDKGREWWAAYVADFRKEGFGATWLDMNDPSTGPVDPHGMRFRDGTEPHAAHHNQYAIGLQMSTHQDFLRANPYEILTRALHSAFGFPRIWALA